MKKIYRIISFCFILTFIGCSDEYFDVNVPSGSVDEEQLRMSDLLAPIILRTMEGQYSVEQTFGNYVQNFTGLEGTAAGETTAGGLWTNVYLYALPNIETMQAKAAELGATNYSAVGDVLAAINLGIATDTWDAIPYSDASLGEENLFPSFDEQQDIYNEIFRLLDRAIAGLQSEDDSDFRLGSDDIIYQGDLSKWLRAAYTLKARYQLHLVNKGTVSASEVLSTIQNGFTSNADDFQMFYDDRTLNPWYSVEILARATGNFHHDPASQMVSTMNGDYYPFQSGELEIDPRLPEFFENDGSDEWIGYVSGGAGEGPNGTDPNTQFVDGGYYTSAEAPLVLITYAEALFIEAEAEFLANGGTTTSMGTTEEGYMAYMDGIAASMAKYGVDGSAYMDDPVVDVGAENLMLHHIMKEKFIHNFLNPETFTDYRRYDFSDDVFIGLTIREEGDSDGDYVGQWFRRATYPSSELNRNGDVVQANQQTPVTPVWWDE